MKQFFVGLLVAVIVSGCASSGRHAPIIERSVLGMHAKAQGGRRRADGLADVYVVKKGDTLYGIAFNYGLNPDDLAEFNNIQDPTLIQVGQQIRLLSATPLSHPINAQRPIVESHPIEDTRPLVESKRVQSFVKEQPKVVKYAYSETAVAKAEAEQKNAVPRVVTQRPPRHRREVRGNNALQWILPTQGKLISGFSESANRKGIDIAGKLGQAIYASAPGKVVYSGSGLRGYGKLLIIKHNKKFLSAYAHNNKLLVKEGQVVKRGQKIAEMGKTDSDRVKLHFEVRRLGKPVDPANYLPLAKL
ncbi:MAG: peptidoglycan DD-metalloendopeptidase family protein [Gallionella sp.]